MSSIIGMLIALLLFFAGIAHADVTPLQITTDPASQGRPDVAGDTIVWKDLRNATWDVYMYDLAGGGESPVIVQPAYQNLPATNGQVVVWQDDRAGVNNNDLYMRNISGGSASGNEYLLVSGSGNQGLPAISDNLVAYVDDHAGNNDIYVVDITDPNNPVKIPICTNTFNQWQPRISGTKVVWEDNRNGNWDIYSYDMTPGVQNPEQPVTLDPGDDRVADISGNRVVWQHLAGSQYDIWIKNLGTGVTSAITNDTAFQNSPRIGGDLVVWENYDYQRATWDVDMKDLTSGIISAVADTGATEARPAIDGETVVWESTTSGNYDVWMAKVLDTVAPVIANQTPTPGSLATCTAPLIAADYSDNRIGIDTSTVRLSVDGNDITPDAQISDTSISYQPPQLADETHHVALSVSDKAGNEQTSSWDFSTSSPNASLSTTRIWWATYDDYLSGDLSVQFHLTNTSQTPVASADVLASTATQGVLMTTDTPASFGPIQPSGGADTVLKYHIPPGINTFKTVLFVGLVDACGSEYYYPGPPPG